MTSIGQTIPLRFGARSLLLLIAFVSLLLTVGVSARTQQLAVSEIQMRGGYVLYDHEVPDEDPAAAIYAVPPSSERGLAVDVYRSVHLVSLDDPFAALSTTPTDDSIIDVILLFSELRYLNMSYTSITDRGLLRLAELQSLKVLDITSTSVSESAVMRFKNKRPSVDIRHDEFDLTE